MLMEWISSGWIAVWYVQGGKPVMVGPNFRLIYSVRHFGVDVCPTPGSDASLLISQTSVFAVAAPYIQ